MNVIARKTLLEFAARHADARDWLEAWFRTASAASWRSFDDVRTTYRSADHFRCCLIFDKGREYRLIVRVVYENEYAGGTLFVKHFLTHAEYSKDRWKKDC